MQGHRGHFDQQCYSIFLDKTSFMDIPNFTIEENFCTNVQLHTPVRLLYGGAFYPDIRNPTAMFEILSHLFSRNLFEFFIYTDYRMKDIVGKFAADYTFIHYNKPISEQEFVSEIYASDILISLGNKQSDFLPSKIFKYMATGKPIIHFYFDKMDSCIPYLKKYKRALLLSLQDDKYKNVNTILMFLSRCSSIHINKEEIYSALEENTPEYTAKKIAGFVKKWKTNL